MRTQTAQVPKENVKWAELSEMYYSLFTAQDAHSYIRETFDSQKVKMAAKMTNSFNKDIIRLD